MSLLDEQTTRGFGPVQIPASLEKPIALLDELDRKIAQLTLDGRVTRREVGLLMGMAPGNISRRLRRILGRLRHPVSAALADRGQALPEQQRQVGIDHFIRGHSVRRIARSRSRTPQSIRLVLEFVRGWAIGLGARDAAGRS